MTRMQPDLQIQLDWHGVIRGVIAAPALADEGLDSWIGWAWLDTVSVDDQDALDATLEDTRRAGVSAFLNVAQYFPSGLELPMEYTTVVRQAEFAMLAVGKSLQAVAALQSRLLTTQRTLEQADSRYRELETRYRILFEAVSDAILVVRADTLRIVEANPAALRALSLTSQHTAEGQDLLLVLDEAEHAVWRLLFSQVRQQSRSTEILVHLGSQQRRWQIHATLITIDMEAVFLLHLTPVAERELHALTGPSGVSLDDLLECSPDGFVVLDADGVILVANRAFLELVQVGARHAVLGEPLGRWLGRPGTDQTILLNAVQRHGGVRLLSTTVQGELGGATEVEISATGGSLARTPYMGVWFRDVSRRLVAAGDDLRIHQVLDSLTEDIGKTSLRKLIVDTVGVVERHFIEAALRLTGGNRTAAAGLLGLSRQSLYVKLSRYEMDAISAERPSDPAA